MVHFTVESRDYAEELIHKLFKEHLAADASVVENKYERFFLKYRKEISQDNLVKLQVVTADSRIPDLLRFIKKENPNTKDQDIPPDLVATQLNAGSKEYIDWIKLQSKPVDPEKEPEPIDELVQS